MTINIEKDEVRHQDANYVLFTVLMECCQIIVDFGDEVTPQATAVICAKNIGASGKTKMTNKEIADCAYRIAAQLRYWDSPHAATIKRILMHLVRTDRWEANLSESGVFNESTSLLTAPQQVPTTRSADNVPSTLTLPPLAPPELDCYGTSFSGQNIISTQRNEEWTANTKGDRRYAFDEEYRRKKAALKRRKRYALLRTTVPWLLLVGLVVSAVLFVDWEAVSGMLRP